MNKNSFLFLTLVALTLIALPVKSFAEETLNEPSPTVSNATPHKEERMKNFMYQKKEIRQEAKTTITQMRKDWQETIKEKRASAEAERKADREAFKEKISELKDARKKMIMENLDTKISSWNKLRTDQFVAVLQKLTSIVDRVEERTNKMKTEGKDTASIETAISTARTAILNAQTAVEAQAGKSYVITVNDETTLKANSKTTIETLQNDLKTTGDSVKAARDAVAAIFKEISKTTQS